MFKFQKTLIPLGAILTSHLAGMGTEVRAATADQTGNAVKIDSVGAKFYQQ